LSDDEEEENSTSARFIAFSGGGSRIDGKVPKNAAATSSTSSTSSASPATAPLEKKVVTGEQVNTQNMDEIRRLRAEQYNKEKEKQNAENDKFTPFSGTGYKLGLPKKQ